MKRVIKFLKSLGPETIIPLYMGVTILSCLIGVLTHWTVILIFIVVWVLTPILIGLCYAIVMLCLDIAQKWKDSK